MILRKLRLKINLLFINLYYGIKDCKHKVKNYFLNKKIERLSSYNFTKCKAIYKGKPRANYDFYVVDYYKFPYSWNKYPSMRIIEMRNKGIVKTKYFHIEKEARKFLSEVT